MVYKANQVTAHFGEANYSESKDRDTEEMTREEMHAHMSGEIAGSEAAITNVLESEDEHNKAQA